MAVIADALIGEVVSQVLGKIMEKKDRAIKFKKTLESFTGTLEYILPTVERIDALHKELDRPPKDMKKLKDLVKKGEGLVEECYKVQWWNWCYKANFQEQLEGVNESIHDFHRLELLGYMAILELENRKDIKNIADNLKNLVPSNSKWTPKCSPPQPPAFTVGLDAPLRELKLRLLQEQVSTSVLTVTGIAGVGKTTLATKFCWDEEVRGKFKENIFFLQCAKTSKLTTLVSRLFMHNGHTAPDFLSEDDAVNQLEQLLKEIGKTPILLVLDDVWPETASLIDKFVFQIPNYRILVTSRSAIGRSDHLYTLKPLGNADATELFRHEASLNQGSCGIFDKFVPEIVRGCGGCPLVLIVTGGSLRNEQTAVVWDAMATKLSKGSSFFDSSSDNVRDALKKNIDITLDPKMAECFRDLALFPETQRIPAAALFDIWALRREDDISAMVKIDQLVKRNMADIVVKRNVERGTVDYNYYYVTQHGLLRDLAISQISEVPTENRSRLIVDINGKTVPEWWCVQNEYNIAARILSISTDEDFNSEWCNLQPTEVEVLVLSLRKKKFKLPMFMKKMNKLKVLIITNYDISRADIENFELLDYLSDLRRVRLEKVSIPFLSKTGVQLKNLRKFSFFMCNVNAAFQNRSVEISDVLPYLEEINIDYCDMEELPAAISNIVSLKKLSITNCHMLFALPGGIGDLINLKTLRLTSCTKLVELPDSVTSLHKLQFLDISECISLNELPNNMGELQSLTKINCRGCSRLKDLPYSITELGGLKVVICDEETAVVWDQFRIILTDLKLEVAEVDFNLNWLL